MEKKTKLATAKTCHQKGEHEIAEAGGEVIIKIKEIMIIKHLAHTADYVT